MSELHVEVERQIGAQAEHVYRCIADFREHHPKFLPLFEPRCPWLANEDLTFMAILPADGQRAF